MTSQNMTAHRAPAPDFLVKRQHSENDNGSSRPGQGSVITPAPAARGKGAFYRGKKRNAYELWRGYLAASVTMIF
ncbi:hypothetical protein [Janthinobacterium sp. BJB304]|uniref:hypothetical protein n=1 Tax=Janthinobacterium sp. BJB304 TaxID=1572871 RepID=UPI00117ADB8D|nr:hypothetical protein [Janthinobacterium sp. BJB304]